MLTDFVHHVLLRFDNTEEFNPDKIIQSGQVFRMTKENNCYRAISGSHIITFRETRDETWEFLTTKEDWNLFWMSYFDLYRSYSRYNNSIMSSDKFLVKATEFSKGMRILHQDLWETIVTFIISQQNQIPKIQKTVNILCERYGEQVKYRTIDCPDQENNQTAFLFPSVEKFAALSNEELKDGTMLGYRSQYILKLARDIENGKFSLEELYSLDYKEATKKLQTVRGIGPKVANCICLYGLHLMESYPIDTWMNKVIAEEYSQYDSVSEYLDYINQNYSGYQGYIQQLQFFYKRNL